MTDTTRTLRIGGGAGFSGDRIDPAEALARDGRLDYLVFECLGERTVALAQKARRLDPDKGYDPWLERRMQAVLPHCARNGTRIVSNMGAANPRAAAKATHAIARDLGLKGMKIAAVTGDDILARVQDLNPEVEELGHPLDRLGNRVVSANAYTGAGAIVTALGQGADVVLCGRAADPAMFLGPLIHEFGWSMQDWPKLGRGTIAGHLLECSCQVTGGYFADPGVKDVPDLANIGYPIGEIDSEGNLTLSKLPGTGGRLDRRTCTEQLLYELHDPARYLQPDVIADFSAVTLTETAPDEVRVEGGTGRERTGLLKVLVGYVESFIGEGQISYSGPGAQARGRLALEVLESRLARLGLPVQEVRAELIGIDSAYPSRQGDAPEVRVRLAARCEDAETAQMIAAEVDGLYLAGPAGGGGVTATVREMIGIGSVYVPETLVTPEIEMMES